MRLHHKIFILLLPVLLLESCGGPRGEFAFKNPGDTEYRKRHGHIEVASNAELQWIYQFPGTYKKEKKFTVIYKKKELVWVEILSYTDDIYFEKSQLFGSIKDFKPGDYELVIFNISSKKITDSLLFRVYEPDEEEEEKSGEDSTETR